MDKYDFKATLTNLGRELFRTPNLLPDFVEVIPIEKKKVSDPDRVKGALAAFYTQLNGFNLRWSHSDFSGRVDISGNAKILPLPEVEADWKEVLWFDHTPTDDPIRQFRILDFFVDEACVGFYEKDKDEQYLYFYDFDDKPVNLYVNMEGYVQLLCAARGFRYWQLVIISFLEKKDNPEADTFNEFMPQIFSGFSLNGFRALYDRVRLPDISKRKK
ncbi:hypothetical protein [Spirosoma areae]